MKKIIAMTMVAILAITAAVGGTMAYLTDTDAAINTFVVGDVQIDLWENFGDNSGIEKLIPATGSAQNDTLKNGVEKEVYVTNTGSEDAFVRVHIAIPAVLDNAQPDFDASQNVLHFNFASENVGEDKWDWSKTTGAEYTGDWNFYTATIEGNVYNVYVVTYDKALLPGETTIDAINQVYLDSGVTTEDIQKIREELGHEWHIYVAAEGAQAAGFENAYEALNAGFGVPGEYTVDWDAIARGEGVDGAMYAAPAANEEELTSGGMVMVTEDIALDSATTVLTEDAMIDLSGNTISANRADTSGAEKYSTLTVAGNVEISGGTVQNETGYAITVKGDEAALTIFSGEYVGGTTAINVVKGDLVIYGGVFMDTNTEDNGHYLINCIDANYNNGTATVTIYGGQFLNWDPSNNTSEGAGTNFVAEGCTVVSREDGEDTWYEVISA